MAEMQTGVTSRLGYVPNKDNVERGMIKIFKAYEYLDLFVTPWRGGSKGLYHISGQVMSDIAIRVEKDKERFCHFHGSREPEPVKVGGLFLYWITKLRPISFFRVGDAFLTEDEFYLNEYLAILAGMNRVVSDINGFRNNTVAFPRLASVIRDLRYNLRYRHTSSDDLTLMLKLITQP